MHVFFVASFSIVFNRRGMFLHTRTFMFTAQVSFVCNAKKKNQLKVSCYESFFSVDQMYQKR